MSMPSIKKPEKAPIGKLWVVRNFRRVIEARDIRLMKRELYEFLHLHCGFIAHFNIDGFKAVYSPPKEFAGVFIRHFDIYWQAYCILIGFICMWIIQLFLVIFFFPVCLYM